MADFRTMLGGHGGILPELRKTQLEMQADQGKLRNDMFLLRNDMAGVQTDLLDMRLVVMELRREMRQVRETQTRHYAEHKAGTAELAAKVTTGMDQIVQMLGSLGATGSEARE